MCVCVCVVVSGSISQQLYEKTRRRTHTHTYACVCVCLVRICTAGGSEGAHQEQTSSSSSSQFRNKLRILKESSLGFINFLLAPQFSGAASACVSYSTLSICVFCVYVCYMVCVFYSLSAVMHVCVVDELPSSSWGPGCWGRTADGGLAAAGGGGIYRMTQQLLSPVFSLFLWPEQGKRNRPMKPN